jgi:inosine-uridine nucleoside N-ribohydrolase
MIKKKGMSLHDPLAVAAVVDPSLVNTERFRVNVETKGSLTRGMTVVDRRRYHNSKTDGNVDICVSVDSRKFLKLFMNRVVYS